MCDSSSCMHLTNFFSCTPAPRSMTTCNKALPFLASLVLIALATSRTEESSVVGQFALRRACRHQTDDVKWQHTDADMVIPEAPTTTLVGGIGNPAPPDHRCGKCNNGFYYTDFGQRQPNTCDKNEQCQSNDCGTLDRQGFGQWHCRTLAVGETCTFNEQCGKKVYDGGELKTQESEPIICGQKHFMCCRIGSPGCPSGSGRSWTQNGGVGYEDIPDDQKTGKAHVFQPIHRFILTLT